MVVVMIIAVLIGIAIPVYLGARSRSQDAKAKSLIGLAVKAQRAYLTDNKKFTTDQAALRREVTQQISFVSTAPAQGANEVQVTVGDVSTAATEQLVCMAVVSQSGTTFTVKDMATGANSGTWYLKGADASTCSPSVTGYSRSW
jgi:type II secretory pathway pseudopilin PulG